MAILFTLILKIIRSFNKLASKEKMIMSKFLKKIIIMVRLINFLLIMI